MNTWLKRTAAKRAVAACLAAAVLCTTVIVPHVWQAEVQGGGKERLFGSHYATNLGDTTDPSWTEEVEQMGIEKGYYPTGLNYASLSYTDVNLFAFWSVPYAETLAQDGFDYAAFKNIVMYCVDKHTGQGAIDQAFTKGVLRMDENGDLVNPQTGEVINATQHATNKKFSMLMLLALMGYKADWSDVIGADGMFSKEDEAEYRLNLTRMLRGLIWIITDEEGFSGDWETDKATFLKHYPGADTICPPSNDPIAAAMGVTTYKDFELFYSAWMAAKLNTNMSFDEDGKATKLPVSSVTNADGSITKSYDFSKELVQAGIQNLLDVQVQGGTYSWDPATGMLNVTAPAGVEVTGNVLAKGDSWDGQVNGSVPNFGTALISRFYWGSINPKTQKIRWDNSQNFMSITFTDAYEFSFGESTPPKSEMHRYDHEEEWNADYNVRLYKFDSETGQPLQDSHFDILEKFDDTQLKKTNLEVSSKDAQGGVSAEELKEVTWDQFPKSKKVLDIFFSYAKINKDLHQKAMTAHSRGF